VLRYARHLARDLQGALVPVLAWLPPGGDLADRRAPCEELRRLWARDACARLQDTLNLAWGEPPADLPVRPVIRRGRPGPVLVDTACRPGDLLVVGAGHRGALTPIAGGRVSRYCLARARCPVLCPVFRDPRRPGAPGAGCEDGDQPDKQYGEHRWGYRARPVEALGRGKRDRDRYALAGQDLLGQCAPGLTHGQAWAGAERVRQGGGGERDGRSGGCGHDNPGAGDAGSPRAPASHNRPEVLQSIRSQFGQTMQAADIADAIAYIVTRPRHVAVNEMLIRPTEQER
jgi:nucleotide-binding universal stress UspA family protein